ncbi:hypothetical protein AB0O91_20975 [Kitasatospora sp. NPDC089797]|uniref:hypothetical protein n=1 Tax=Kitasatospora sp. NPDC089797 TaxID=3155298 RepID=UPI00343C65FA
MSVRRDQLPTTAADFGRAVDQIRREARERAAQLLSLLRRADGTIAARVTATWSWLDRAGNTLIAEDPVAGSGLARPWVAYSPPTDDNSANWPRTAASSWTTIARSRGITQHPKVRIRAAVVTDSGTAGQIRLCVNGTPVATGAVGAELNTTAPLPSFVHMAEVEFTLQAQVTSGAGNVYGTTRYLYGVQS